MKQPFILISTFHICDLYDLKLIKVYISYSFYASFYTHTQEHEWDTNIFWKLHDFPEYQKVLHKCSHKWFIHTSVCTQLDKWGPVSICSTISSCCFWKRAKHHVYMKLCMLRPWIGMGNSMWAQQRIFFLRHLNKFAHGLWLSGSALWSLNPYSPHQHLYGLAPNQSSEMVFEIVIECNLLSLQAIYSSRDRKHAGKIIDAPFHPRHRLFHIFPSRRRLRVITVRKAGIQTAFLQTAFCLSQWCGPHYPLKTL